MCHRRAFLCKMKYVIRGDENSMVADWLRHIPISLKNYVIGVFDNNGDWNQDTMEPEKSNRLKRVNRNELVP